MVCQYLQATPGLYYLNGRSAIQGASSIIGFNADLGLNNNESTLTVEVALDPCGGGAGSVPRPGEPVIFFYDGFQFGGITNKSSTAESESGNKWTINIVDPRKLLENTKILLRGFYCDSIENKFGFVNFINLQNYLEGNSAGSFCSGQQDSYTLPSVNSAGCSSFGLSGSGDSNGYKYGTSYYLGLLAIQNRMKKLTTITGQQLNINLTPVISAVSSIRYVTADETHMSLLQFITNALDEAGYDFICGLDTSGIIQFTLINRKNQPAFGVIQQLINASKANQTLLSYSYGLEETNLPTQKVVMGDNISYLKVLDNLYDKDRSGKCLKNIFPFCGYDTDGTTPLVGQICEDKTSFNINIESLNDGLSVKGGQSLNFDTIEISENEILASATIGMWKTYGVQYAQSLIGQLLRLYGGGNFTNLATAVLNALAGIAGIPDEDDPNILVGQANAVHQLSQALSSLTSIDNIALIDDFAYNWFRNWINEYYGKQWIINIPEELICANPVINDSGQLINKVTAGGNSLLSDYPTDAGYPGYTQSNILGISIGSNNMQIFESDDGRIECFCRISEEYNSDLYINKLKGKRRQAGFNDIVVDTIEDDTIKFKLDSSYLSGDYVLHDNQQYYIKSDTINGTMFRGKNNELGILVQTPFIPSLVNYTNNDNVTVGLRAIAVIAGLITPINNAANPMGQFNALFSKEQPRMSIPNAICIPMKSNMYIYGPWLGKTGVVGGVEIIDNKELNPLNYGGYNNLYRVGNMLAQAGLKSQNQTETGSLSIAGGPSFSLGPFQAGGTLVVRNISFQYGSNGVTTNYDFATFTPKFGNYAQYVANKMRENTRISRELNRTIKEIHHKNVNSINSARQAIDRKRGQILTNPTVQPSTATQSTASSSSTLQVLIFNSYPSQLDSFKESQDEQTEGTSGSVSNQKKTCQEIACFKPQQLNSVNAKGSNNKRFNNLAGLDKSAAIEHYLDKNNYSYHTVMSLDMILSPVSINGEGNLPRFGRDGTNYKNFKGSRSKPVMPPVFIGNKLVGVLPIVQDFLNPMVSKALLANWNTDNRAAGSIQGFACRTITHGTDLNRIFSDQSIQASSDFRFSALKGPLVLQSWGYDTYGKPIPNASDSTSLAETGYFNKVSLQDKFLPNWLGNPKTWPVGPIDLRWDRDRGVWVAPPPEKIVIAQLLTDLNGLSMTDAVLLNPTSSGGEFYDNYSVYGPEGQHISGNFNGVKIKVVDFLGRRLCKGTVVYVYHYSEGKYIVLESSAVNEETCDCTEDCTTTSTTSTTSTTTTSTTSTTSTTTTSTTSTTETTTPTTPPTTTYTTTPTETLTPTCDACDLAACLQALNQGDGVLGIENGCLKIYPIAECGAV